MPSTIVTLTLNGTERELIARPSTTLLDALRETFGLMGAKRGCGQGGCGSCTVLLDGRPVVSCLIPVVTVDGSAVETIEGLADGDRLTDVQQAFVDHFATQCGFCTPGMIMSATALLDREPDPTRQDVAEAICGNVCRCTGYEPIITAVLSAAARRRAAARADV
ncbi:(2Fe-2S)-binding protein [Nonomuraea gerenzanensis]|uniref:Xanthine dehydrogenase iron-sulfur subunit n=1 Tax=Nonomuraea gerenzanensis TaxID=93944 RepID=A0A1M4EIL6_9ACTN|nr:(2Fe-2S)-binding protein [Nonomuraea gerenzanensis]UBU10274.1 (2Fe-2S)-binding protein [Nonomuraea gerenzanensis]SBO98656.1 Xanthine dehydrogenase iron-sulfur subunit [Nonomuraea gerenzanensis]